MYSAYTKLTVSLPNGDTAIEMRFFDQKDEPNAEFAKALDGYQVSFGKVTADNIRANIFAMYPECLITVTRHFKSKIA